MKKFTFLAVVAVFGLAAAGYAQQNAAWNLLDSPVKVEAEIYQAGETVQVQTMPLPGALFGCDQIFGTSPVEFIGNELFSPFTVWRFDESLTGPLAQWSTATTTTTLTGLSFDEATTTTYWSVDPFGAFAIKEHNMTTGTATGNQVSLALGFPGVWGPLAINNNVPGKKGWCEDIAADVALEYDLTGGPLGGSIPNPDNGSGAGAYGNGLSEAADPAACSGATMVMTSGLITEFQVARASQIDAGGSPLCYETWELLNSLAGYGETFVNGIEEHFASAGGKRLMVMGNATSVVYNVGRPVGIFDCQGKDAPQSDTLYVNAAQGPNFTVGIDNTAPLAMAMQKPAGSASPGKFVVHMNSGAPSAGTLTNLPAALGTACFPLLIPPSGTGAPVCVWNNIGKTDKVGGSNYFGTPIANPTNAPSFFHLDADGDALNLPLSSQWTVQGIILNSLGSSPKSASLTNGVVIDVTAGI